MSSLPGHVGNVASTSAWGNADPLDTTLDRIASHTDATVVELAIGAKPVRNPKAALESHSGRFTYIGHHAMPVGDGTMIRPRAGDAAVVRDVCLSLGITRYSAHPPSRREAPDDAAVWEWAVSYAETLGSVGIEFLVESMYPVLSVEERRKVGDWPLASRKHVEAFAARAESVGWSRFFVADLAHLHIGLAHGAWDENGIEMLMSSGWAGEVHVSDNDGIRDNHLPVTESSVPAQWLRWLPEGTDLVDEGRRDRNGRGKRDTLTRADRR